MKARWPKHCAQGGRLLEWLVLGLCQYNEGDGRASRASALTVNMRVSNSVSPELVEGCPSVTDKAGL